MNKRLAMFATATLLLGFQASSPGFPPPLALAGERNSAQSAREQRIAERKEANYNTTIAVLKQYLAAQEVFTIGKMGRAAGNTGSSETGYADNFRNLYYGVQPGFLDQMLKLMSKEIADAFAGPTQGAAPVNRVETPSRTASPYQGYLFLEPPGVDFLDNCALAAYPARAYVDGDYIFMISKSNGIKFLFVGDMAGSAPAAGMMPKLLTAQDMTRYPWEDLR